MVSLAVQILLDVVLQIIVHDRFRLATFLAECATYGYIGDLNMYQPKEDCPRTLINTLFTTFHISGETARTPTPTRIL
jgi:hypothetical protein